MRFEFLYRCVFFVSFVVTVDVFLCFWMLVLGWYILKCCCLFSGCFVITACTAESLNAVVFQTCVRISWWCSFTFWQQWLSSFSHVLKVFVATAFFLILLWGLFFRDVRAQFFLLSITLHMTYFGFCCACVYMFVCVSVFLFVCVRVCVVVVTRSLCLLWLWLWLWLWLMWCLRIVAFVDGLADGCGGGRPDCCSLDGLRGADWCWWLLIVMML